MSDHHDHHADSHDHGHHADGSVNFDETTNILAPILIIVLLIVIFGVLFFG